MSDPVGSPLEKVGIMSAEAARATVNFEAVEQGRQAETFMKLLAALQPLAKEAVIAQLLPGEGNEQLKYWAAEILTAVETGADLTAIFDELGQIGDANHALILAAAYRVASASAQSGRNATEIAARLEALLAEVSQLAEIKYESDPLNLNFVPLVFIEELNERYATESLLEQTPEKLWIKMYASHLVLAGAAVGVFTLLAGLKYAFSGSESPPNPPPCQGNCTERDETQLDGGNSTNPILPNAGNFTVILEDTGQVIPGLNITPTHKEEFSTTSDIQQVVQEVLNQAAANNQTNGTTLDDANVVSLTQPQTPAAELVTAKVDDAAQQALANAALNASEVNTNSTKGPLEGHTFTPVISSTPPSPFFDDQEFIFAPNSYSDQNPNQNLKDVKNSKKANLENGINITDQNSEEGTGGVLTLLVILVGAVFVRYCCYRSTPEKGADKPKEMKIDPPKDVVAPKQKIAWKKLLQLAKDVKIKKTEFTALTANEQHELVDKIKKDKGMGVGL
jgi:hypothetical protein